MTRSCSIDCEHCDATTSASAKFCPSCGKRQQWFTDRPGERIDPGAEVRDAYATMFDRAEAADGDPSDGPESYEHALRLLIPTAHVGTLEEVDPR